MKKGKYYTINIQKKKKPTRNKEKRQRNKKNKNTWKEDKRKNPSAMSASSHRGLFSRKLKFL